MAVSQSLLNQVQDLYIAFYDRPADLGGLNYWAGVVANDYNGNVQGILQDFANSPESQNLYGTITSSNVGTVINDIYNDLFDRNAGQGGLQYWTNAYNTYHMSPGELAYDILNGAQGTDTTTIYNKLQAANVFTQTEGNNYTTALIPTAKSFINAVTATTDLTQITPSSVSSYTQSFQTTKYSFTNGVTALVGTNPNNDVFTASPTTSTTSPWNAGESITGAQGATNILNFTDTGTTAFAWNLNPANTSVSGVQTVNVTEPNGPITINTTNWTGVTNLNITDSDGTIGNTTVTAAPTTTISLIDNNLGGNTDTINGGQNVSVTEYNVGSGAKIIDGNSAAATPTLGSITTVSLDAANAAGVVTITDNNLQTLTVNNFEGTGSTTSPKNVAINDNSAVSGVPTALTLNVNNDILGGTSPTITPTTITESDQNPAGNKGQYTTLNVVTGAKPSNLSLAFNAATALNVSGNSALTLASSSALPVLSTVAISGAAGFTANNAGAAVLPTTLTSITDSSSGVVNVVLPTNLTATATTASFDGSKATGQEIVTITQPVSASIQGGTATNNELVISPSSNFATSATTGAINSFGTGTISGFEVLGINDSSTTGNNFDIAALGAQLGSFNNTVDLQNVKGNDTLYNLANASTLLFNDKGDYNETNSAITAQFAGTSGTTDTANIVFNHIASTPVGITVSNLSFTDSATTPNGIGTLNITDTTFAKDVTDTIKSLSDNFTTLNINSNNTFTISAPSSDGTPSPVSINLSGSGQFTLTNLSLTSAPSLTITDNSIYNLTNNPNSYFGITGGSSFTTLNLAGSHTIDITSLVLDVKSFTIIDNSTGATANLIDSITDTALTNLNISGSHSIDIGSSFTSTLTPSAGITINSSNTAGVDLFLTSVATYTNNITFGNGTNSLTLNSTTTTSGDNIANNITVNGNSNTIILNDSPSGGTITNTVTLASPNQDINHYTAIIDAMYTKNGSGNYVLETYHWSDLVLTFSNTINSNNSGATSITAASIATGSTFQAALNQAIQQASISSPFDYFNITDNLVPGHPGGGSSSNYDTVIVDHSQTNLGTTFVPGQDAFIVLVGSTTAPTAPTISSAGHIAA